MVTIPRKPAWLMSLSPAQVERVQRQLNDFTNRRLDGVVPLIVDGKVGKLTRDRVVMCKFWLGYVGKRNSQVKRRLMRQLAHPNWRIYFPKGWIKLGTERRADERRRYIEHRAHAATLRGTAIFDGIVVAAYFVPILTWCRQHTWKGRVISGYRTPEHSEHLCELMCGAPTCPGRCAGRSTNHSGLDPNASPCGAVDVTDYETFGRVVANCPLRPRIFNSLPIDRPHFSPHGN